METFHFQKIFSLLFLPFFFHFSSLFFPASGQSYNLPDRYFINCGSSSSPTVFGRRNVTGDQITANLTLSSAGSRTVEDSSSSTVQIYQSARIFTRASGYDLDISENGIYVVRFHFFPFPSLGNVSDARFDVTASGFSLLSQFSIQNRGNYPLIEEFFLTLPVGNLRIEFVPNNRESNSFAFVNAMEVFIAPPSFILDSPPPPRITRNGFQANYTGAMSGPFRVVQRINVGGGFINPSNDTLLRTWIPDDGFLLNRSSARNSTPYIPRPYYPTIAAVFDAPDSVYQTAKQMNISNNGTDNNFNISWSFGVRRGATHLVRVHFCDIVSQSTDNLRFNFFIYTQYSDEINPGTVINQLAVPFYVEYVVDSDDSGFLNVSIGPRNDSRPPTAFMNGIEIMELIFDRSIGSNSSTRNLLPIILGSVAGGVVLILFVIILAFLLLGRKKKKMKPDEEFDFPSAPQGTSFTSDKTSIMRSPLLDLNLGLRMPFGEILDATNKFDPKLVIGEGGFGKVYKGMLRNGTKVAVKRSDPGQGQGLHEFQSEIIILSQIRHQHLVALIGYCDERDEMILVYEFMEKGTLRDHLYSSKGESKQGSKLSWTQRLSICIGAAKGIHYLHTSSDRSIIHRDIKSTNILLDENYVAKVGDFGLSRSGQVDQSFVNTDVKGSFGYFDPEYFRCSQLTQKSDVYSFGVVLLEVVCARPVIDVSLPTDEVNIVEWGLSWLRKGEMEKIIDPVLVGKINSESLRKFGETVDKCLQENGADRPNMVDVLWDLEYTLQLQTNSGQRQRLYEDSTTDVIPMQFLERLPSDSIPFGEDELSRIEIEGYSINSDASRVNDSLVFSQLNVGEAR